MVLAFQAQPAAADVETLSCDGIEPLAITDFEPGLARLSMEAKSALAVVAEAASANGCILTVTGYASVDGTAKTNNALSQERAWVAAGYLIFKRLPSTHIHVVNVGETDQFGDLAANRRVAVEATPTAGRLCSKDRSREERLPMVTVADYKSGVLDPSDEAKALLTKAAAAYVEDDCAIEILGYASADGDFDENRRRSGDRAQRVADFLIEQEVDPNLLHVVAIGETDEFGPKLSANRRVIVAMK